MSDKKADLKRDNTMKVTAKEGIKLLKDAGEHTLLELQGLDNDKEAESSSSNRRGNGKPRLPRLSTMAATAKEGEEFLREHPTKKEQPQQQQAKPKLSKFTTMLQTKQEGEAFLASKEEVKTNDEPASKKLKTTNKKPAAKRISTIMRTTKEGEELLKGMGHKDDHPGSERRTTRSQTRGDPQPVPLSPRKKPAPKDNTTNERGHRGRGRPRKNQTNTEKGKEGIEEATPLDGDEDDHKDKEDDAEKKKKIEVEKEGKKDGEGEIKETSSKQEQEEKKKDTDSELKKTNVEEPPLNSQKESN